MKIVIPNECVDFECRVAITPEVSKKLTDLGHDVVLEKGAGTAAGMPDAAYEAAGAKIAKDTKSLYQGADIIIRVSPPTSSEVTALPKDSILIGMLKPFDNEKLAKELAKKKITAFALEFIPRISRAQSMDVLSIAMARRLGAIVSAFDVRPAVKEQVESLGATFVEVESTESGDGSGGYAKEMSADYKKRQQAKLEEVMRQQDIVITTAQIPGKPAPVLITQNMVKDMKTGSIIVDLAIESGGNCAGSVAGKVVEKQGVKIMGYPNFPSRIPFDASQVYARNALNFLTLLLASDKKTLDINWKDEIILGAALCHEGAVIHPSLQAAPKKEKEK